MKFLRISVPSFKSKTNLLLLVGVMIQGALILGISWRELNGVRKTLGMPALWRGANFSQGGKFADYTLFLNENIPATGRVVLPPAGYGPRALGTTPYMQFFLAPREVINCTDLACAQNLSPENTYLLVVEGFPGDEAAKRFGEQRMFNDKWGVLSPSSAPPGQSAHLGFNRLVDILLAALLPLLWLGTLAFSGYLLVTSLAPNLPSAMRLGLGYALGLGLLTAGLGLAWLAGAPLTGTVTVVVTALLLVVSMVVYFLRARDASSQPARLTLRPAGLPDPWVLAFLFLSGVAAVLAVGQGYSVSDEIVLWGAKGYGIAATGSLANIQDWGTNTTIYPLHVPILIAAFKFLFAETLPAAKLAFSGYYLALLLFSYHFLTWKGVTRSRAGLATLLLATVPLAFRHATLAYANLPLAFSLLCGVVLLSGALQERTALHPMRAYILAGLLLSMAAWTRPEGLGMAVLCALALFLYDYLRWRKPPSIKKLAVFAAPLLAYGLFWVTLKARAYTQPAGRSGLLGNALQAVSSGQWHLDEALYILRSLAFSLIDPLTWGVFGLVLLLFALLSLRKGYRRHAQAAQLALTGVICLGAVLGMYYITSYDTNHDISWWVSTGLERMLLPAASLLWLGLFLGGQPLDNGEDRPIPADLEYDRRAGV